MDSLLKGLSDSKNGGFLRLFENWHALCNHSGIAVPKSLDGISRGNQAMFNTIRTAAPRFLTAAAASSAVIVTFALGMAPMAAHATAATGTTVTALQAPVEINDNGAPSLRISYADLDLSNATDRNEMNRRVAHAATRVCASLRGSTMEVERSIAYQNCRTDAISQAVAQIESSAD